MSGGIRGARLRARRGSVLTPEKRLKVRLLVAELGWDRAATRLHSTPTMLAKVIDGLPGKPAIVDAMALRLA